MNTNDENMEAVEILVNSRHDYLSDWEAEFLDDISVRLEAGRSEMKCRSGASSQVAQKGYVGEDI